MRDAGSVRAARIAMECDACAMRGASNLAGVAGITVKTPKKKGARDACALGESPSVIVLRQSKPFLKIASRASPTLKVTGTGIGNAASPPRPGVRHIEPR